MSNTPDKWLPSAEKQKENKQLLNKLQQRKYKGLEKELPALHEEAFSHIDCLECAACCKHYSPRFKTPDIKRISKQLRMRESDFIETYLRVDEDGDFVVRSVPCPFLGQDNRCSIYAIRPSDCARFPYTDEDVLLKRPAITLKNASFCPAVAYVLEQLKDIIK